MVTGTEHKETKGVIMRTRNFSSVVQQYWDADVTRFQPGYTVPNHTPDQFGAELQGEAANWKAFGGTWAEPDEAIAEMVFAAGSAYKSWYTKILKLPLPMNPLPEYEAWYNANHS